MDLEAYGKQKLKEALLNAKKNGCDRVDAADRSGHGQPTAQEYKTFLDAGKTERLCAAETVRLAQSRRAIEPYGPGTWP